MVCFHPIRAYYPLETDNQGKRYLKFGRQRYQLGIVSSQYLWMQEESIAKMFANNYDGDFPTPIYYSMDGEEKGLNIKVPCGKCIGCRLDYSRNWATRSVHEAFMYNYYKNCAFLTLTFNNDMLLRRENPYSVNKTAFRCWIKRLRKAVKAHYNTEFRLMACGEYGARHSRPHYHMLVYGFDFPDKKPFQIRRIHGHDVIYYRSEFLEKIWSPAHDSSSYGFSVIGDVNFESSAYVARYVTKKLFGAVAEKLYKEIEPEFLTTSRMPGLGFDYLCKYKDDIFNHGYIMLPNKHKAPIPRYYVNKLKEIDENKYNEYRITTFNNMCDNLFVENLDNTQERLYAREELKKLKLNILHREYEFNSSENPFYDSVNSKIIVNHTKKNLDGKLHNIHSPCKSK